MSTPLFPAVLKTQLLHCCLALAFSITSAQAAGEDPLTKPHDPRPKTLKELEDDPDFKRAPLMIEPGSPLSTTKTQPGDITQPQTAWQWHKNAMHLKAVKRSGQDNRPLSITINELMKGTPGAPAEPESGFEKITMPNVKDASGVELTFFRFTNLSSYIKDGPERTAALQAAIALGKAFFWDPRFSSDQKVSCASCHYAAGTDHRTRGVVSLPSNFGFRIPWPRSDAQNGYTPYQLTSTDLITGSSELEGKNARGLFDPASVVGYQIREVIGSLGVPHKLYAGTTKEDGTGDEKDLPLTRPVHGDEKIFGSLLDRIHEIETNHRQVTPRNAGTVINAVFNHRNFHDSRASTVFNGHTGWGQHTDDTINQALYVLRKVGNKYVKTYTWSPTHIFQLDPGQNGTVNPYYIANASLASQAVEPILSDVEMSSRGRLFHHLARRMLDEPILKDSTIDPTDSALHPYAVTRQTYRQLITAAFHSQWLGTQKDISLVKSSAVPANSPKVKDTFAQVDYDNYDLTEANFGLIWGLALHLYQSTLISGATPFDIELENSRLSTRVVAVAASPVNASTLRKTQPMTAAARRGFNLFRTTGCVECHSGAEFTAASFLEPGLLKTRNGKLPGDDMFEPVPGDDPEDEDIIVGANLCPPNKPAIVECMQMAGRFESLYDGGNYNIGISRYFRSPNHPGAERWPNQPPVLADNALKQPLTALLYPQHKSAIWEDSGNGNFFLPPESGLNPTTNPAANLSEFVRGQFGAYLKTNPAAYAEVLRILSVPETANLGAPIIAANTDLLMDATQAAFGNATATRKMTLRTDLTAAEKTALVGAARTIINQPAIALNYTQQTRRFTKTDLAAPAPSKTRDTLTAKEKQALVDRGLIPGLNGGPTVTPATPPPPHSVTRRWKQDGNPDVPEEYRERISDGGAFKAPTLRNIELTGPYMHNGSLLTLEAVIDFYAQGGDYNHPLRTDPDQFKTGDIHPEMAQLQLSTEQRADLVAFLKTLTDERVRMQSAPFDHPSLRLVINTAGAFFKNLPAVGAKGTNKPTPTFEQVLQHNHTD